MGSQNKLVPIQTSRRKWGNERYMDINANRIINGRTEQKALFGNWSVDGSGSWSSVEPLNVSGILVWYTNPRFCLEYHGYMTLEQAWRESQETGCKLSNGRNLSSMTYVGIGIHPTTVKTRSSEDGLVFHTMYRYLAMLLDPKWYWYCVSKDYITSRDTGRNREYRDHE